MDHGAVIRRTLLALVALLCIPATAGAAGATLVTPADGAHFDSLELAPMVQFDPSTDSAGKRETPRWVLLATDPEMKNTVRYCRYFVWAQDSADTTGAFHWGCNRWATGADQLGNDQLVALEAGTTYYWQVVSKSNVADAADIVSSVRAFAVDAEEEQQSIADISNKIYGTAIDDGTYLNLGAAAYVNSGVRVKEIRSTRLKTFVFRIHVRHLGTIDRSRSYIKVSSAAGTRYLKITSGSTGRVWTSFVLSAKERKLKTKRFTYQAFLKSTVNGSLVRSAPRVILIKSSAAKAPAWTPDT